MVPRYHIPSRRASSGAPHQEGTSVPSRGLDISPPTRTVETVGLASEGAQLIDSGLSTEVVETILNLRALKWRVFTSLCSDHQLDPVNCPVGTVLEFLQERFTAGLPVHFKGLCGGHKCLPHSFGWNIIGEDPLVSRFPQWYLRLCPPPFRMRTRKGTICFAQCRH